MPNDYLVKKKSHQQKVNDGKLKEGMKMVDLIFHNPPGEPMPSSKKKKTSKSSANDKSDHQQLSEEAVDDAGLNGDALDLNSDQSDEEEPPIDIAPKVKFDADGKIVIDEESLILKTTKQKQMEANAGKKKYIEVDHDDLPYGRYNKKKKRSCDWTRRETGRFYKALAVAGTDFSLMSQVFVWRSRAELKQKFKKEEQKNKHLVDLALGDCRQFDFTVFEESDYDHEEDRKTWKEEEKAKDKQKKLLQRQERKAELDKQKLHKKEQKNDIRIRKKNLRAAFKPKKKSAKSGAVEILKENQDSNASEATNIVVDTNELTFEVIFGENQNQLVEDMPVIPTCVEPTEDITEEGFVNQQKGIIYPRSALQTDPEGSCYIEVTAEGVVKNVPVPSLSPRITHVVLVPGKNKDQTVYHQYLVSGPSDPV